MESTYNTQAIILKKTPKGENDLEIDLYSPDYGRMFLGARGALRKGAKLAGHLEPITLGDFMIIRGKGSDYIGSALGENFYLNIKEDLEKIKYASLALRSLDRYTRLKDPLPLSFFDDFRRYLDILNKEKGEGKYDLFYISFLLKFASALGFSPDFYKCVNCSKNLRGREKGEKIVFDIAGGGVLCPDCSSGKTNEKNRLLFSVSGLKLSRFLAGEDFYRIKRLKVSSSVFKEAFN